MNYNLLNRLIYFPLGLTKKLIELGKNGSRDLNNKKRFKNSIIDQGCCIDNLSQINDYTHILSNTLLLNSQVDSYTYIGKSGMIQNCQIGKFCSIANEVCIGLGNHPITNFSTATLFYKKYNKLKVEFVEKDSDFIEYKNIEIGHDVWIGIRSIILDGVKIGHGAIVAANSVVSKDVPPYAIVGGVPAKIIRYRFSEEKISQLLESNWWNKDLHEINNDFNYLNKIVE